MILEAVCCNPVFLARPRFYKQAVVPVVMPAMIELQLHQRCGFSQVSLWKLYSHLSFFSLPSSAETLVCVAAVFSWTVCFNSQE